MVMTLNASRECYNLNEINHSILKLKAVRGSTAVLAVTVQMDMAIPLLEEAHQILANAIQREWETKAKEIRDDG